MNRDFFFLRFARCADKFEAKDRSTNNKNEGAVFLLAAVFSHILLQNQ